MCDSLDLFTIMLDLYLTSLPNSFFNELTVVTFEQLNVFFLNLIRSTAFTFAINDGDDGGAKNNQ